MKFETSNTIDAYHRLAKSFDILVYTHMSGGRDIMPPISRTVYSVYFKIPDTELQSTYFLAVFEVKFWIAIVLILLCFVGYLSLKHYWAKT